jgi:hypothetical protein
MALAELGLIDEFEFVGSVGAIFTLRRLGVLTEASLGRLSHPERQVLRLSVRIVVEPRDTSESIN